MTIMLGPLDLGEEMVLRGLEADRVAFDRQYSDEGVLQILTAPVDGGRDLELHGWLTYAVEEQVLALSAQMIPVLLEHPRFTGMVLVQGTDTEDVLTEYVNPGPTDQRLGSIFVIEV